MTTVPPPTLSPLTVAGPVAPATIVAASKPPATIAALAPGTTLDGTVTGDVTQNGRTAVAIATSAGEITLSLPAPLPAGADVELQLLRASPDQATFRLIAVDDQPGAQVLAQLRQELSALASGATAQPQPTPDLTATTATPAPASALPPAAAWTPQGPVPLTTVGTISATVVASTATTATPATEPVAATPTIANSPIVAAPTAAGLPMTSPLPLVLPTGAVLSLRIVAVELPAEPVPSATITPPTPSPPATNTTPANEAPTAVFAPNAAAAPPAPLTLQPTPAAPAPTGAAVTAESGLVEASADPAAPLPAASGTVQSSSVTPQPSADASVSATETEAAADIAPAIDAGGGAPVSARPALVLAGPDGLAPAPPSPPAAVAPQPPQATVVGIVAVDTANAAPVVTTSTGQIQLNVAANLPAGTRLTLEIAALAPPPADLKPVLQATPSALPMSGPPAQFGGTPVGWPTISEAIELLRRADPRAAAEFAGAIPDGGPRSALALVAFVQAMRSGDRRSWPGDENLRALERLGPRGAHLANQIDKEISALSSRAHQSSGEWRALPVPWNADGRIDRIALITRREGEDESNAGKKGRGGAQRFIINLDLSRLGPLQLDGMFRREGKLFDLVIRSKAALPDAARRDLSEIFGSANAAMGLAGGLIFQVVRTFPDPIGDAQPAGSKPGLWA